MKDRPGLFCQILLHPFCFFLIGLDNEPVKKIHDEDEWDLQQDPLLQRFQIPSLRPQHPNINPTDDRCIADKQLKASSHGSEKHDEERDQVKIGIEPGGKVYRQGDHQGIEEEDDAQERKFVKIGWRQARGNHVGEEVGENEEGRKSLWKGGITAKNQQE